jgi:hypothetical protein
VNSKLTGLPLLEGCTQLLPSFALLLCVQLMAVAPTHAVGALAASTHSGGADPIYLVIRSDDEGMSHSVNVALEKLINTANSGLKIDYVDYHVGTVFNNPQFRDIAEHLANEHRLGVMQYFGERRHNPQYDARPQDKTDSLISLTTRLKSGFTVLVTQVGIHDPLIAMQV